MTVVALSYLPVQAFLSNNGLPLVGGQLFSYQAGTSTPAATYTDSTGSVSLPNPIILNARGEIATSTGASSGLWIPPNTAYKFVLEDVLGNTIWTIDQVISPLTTASLGSVAGNIVPSITNTYNLGSSSFTWANGYFGTSLNVAGIPVPTYPQTSAEIAAGVTPTNYTYSADIPRIDLRRYGLSTAASAATNTTAITNAAAVAHQLGGAILVAPAGTFQINAVTISNSYISIIGEGPLATIWSFSPGGGGGVAFSFNAGASSVWGFRFGECSFTSGDSSTKTAIAINDGRDFVVERVWISSGSWLGTSIGIQTNGRDLGLFRKLDMACQRPVVIGINTNFTSLNCDFFRFEHCQLITTSATGKNIEVLNGVDITNLTLEDQDWAGGQYGFYWSDSTSPVTSYGLSFRNCRTEQGQTAAGYSVYLSTTVGMQGVRFDNCVLDSALNGILCSGVNRIGIDDSIYQGVGGTTALNITFGTITELVTNNFLANGGSSVTFTNGRRVWSSPTATSNSPIPSTGFWFYDPGTAQAQAPWYMNDAKKWAFKGTITAAGTLTIPVVPTSNILASYINIAGYSATGPISEGGSVILGATGGAKLVGGTANFAATNTASKLCVIDVGAGQAEIINNTAQTLTIVIETVYVTG